MAVQLNARRLPLPDFFDADKASQFYRVPYELLATAADDWAREQAIPVAAGDSFKICLLLIDVQNTFCLPEFELFVGGRSGTGAVEDTARITRFIYTNMANLTQIALTMDTHSPIQIFHAIYLVDDEGRHPEPMTLVTAEDVASGRWKFNPAIAPGLGITPEYGQAQLADYTRKLEERGKYALTIWPYHSILGGIGHAIVSAVEEAVFFHSIARSSQPDFIIKGDNPLTESYSAIGPEVQHGPDGRVLGRKHSHLFEKLLQFDALVIAGEAKSHCVAWTVDDLLNEILEQDASLASKVYLLEDCTTPVVSPGIVDYTEQADAAFERFAQAGMHRVLSTDPIETWPGLQMKTD